MSDKVLQRSIQSAVLNISAVLVFRVLSFFTNAYILRCVTREVLGIGVRITLLMDTILFLSREPFRKACLSRPKNNDWRSTINLVWLSIPIGAVLSLLLGYVWIHVLDLPPDEHVEQYVQAVKTACVVCMLLLMSEPFYVVGQVYLHVKFRSAADLFYILMGAFAYCFVVAFYPDQAVFYFAFISIPNSLFYLFLNLVYFSWVFRCQEKLKKKKDVEKEIDFIPFESLWQFLPSGLSFDHAKSLISLSFFKQGFLKQFLTEGEKYMFTWFNLMPLSDQGVFDVIANLGSIPARLFFSKVEESSHLYFSQSVTRKSTMSDTDDEKAASKYLHSVLKGFLLFGIVICTFGFSYSHALLHIYGGTLLSTGIGPSLLQMQCFYVMFLAVNGITECYAFCAMTQEEVSKYNYFMAVMTFVYIVCTWLFAKLMGPIGFIVANCFNFSMRIFHNLRVIKKRHEKSPIKPLDGIFPQTVTVIFLIVAGILCQVSEIKIYPLSMIWHIGVGGVIFALSLAFMCWKEDWLRQIIITKMLHKKIE